MAISHIQPEAGPQQNRLQEAQKAARAPERRPESEPTPARLQQAKAVADQLSLTAGIDPAKAADITVERVLARLEAEQSVGGPRAQEAFAAAGKPQGTRVLSAEQAQAEGVQADTSPEATAGRILDGITGYIFKAWQQTHPDMTAEEFTEFETQVMKGFEAGLKEAKDILTGLRVMDADLEASIGETETIVRDGLKTFFESVRDSLASAPGAEFGVSSELDPEPAAAAEADQN